MQIAEFVEFTFLTDFIVNNSYHLNLNYSFLYKNSSEKILNLMIVLFIQSFLRMLSFFSIINGVNIINSNLSFGQLLLSKKWQKGCLAAIKYTQCSILLAIGPSYLNICLVSSIFQNVFSVVLVFPAFCLHFISIE